MLAADFGDAPDTAAGTGRGNYSTVSSDGGPSHLVPTTPEVFLGASVDTEVEALPNPWATGDDVTNSPDDEDGLANPLADLILTVGTQPAVNVIATNTSGEPAMLFGWIDFDADGIFDNGLERAQSTVPDATDGDIITLTFPTIPFGFVGDTYARFRLSTDAAAQDPTGAASDGEVEDYPATIVLPSDGTVGSFAKISDTAGDFTGGLVNGDNFGRSITTIEDLNGDGQADLAVGAPNDNDGGIDRGAIWIQFLNADGSVQSHQKISDSAGSFSGSLDDSDRFGISVASLSDLNGDGMTDLAVGAASDDDGGTDRGAVWILFLGSDGRVQSHQKISDTEGGFTGVLGDSDLFGFAAASVGDLDGDGVTDVAVGATGDDDGGTDRGAVWVLFLNTDGTVKSHQKISDNEGNFTGLLDDYDQFGISIANLGDMDGDGVVDLAVGAFRDDDGGPDRGAIWLLHMNDNGTVKSHQKISATAGNFSGPLDDGDYFGRSATSVGDLNGDGVPDLAVGASRDNDGGNDLGAVWILFLAADGSVASHQKISDTAGEFEGTIDIEDRFGVSVTSLNDLNGDGVLDLAVGANGDDDGGNGRGAVWIVNLRSNVDFGDAPDTGEGTGNSNYRTLPADGGPGHFIVEDIFIGTRVDGEAGIPNAAANGDDVDGALPDDEDGLVNPSADLTLTVGTTPKVNMRATNSTGLPATLSGWIDYNADGLFDNATERAQILVPGATSNTTVILNFPEVPIGFTGQTYARFRLSTDANGQNPTGFATDGEVEDYTARILLPSTGRVRSQVKITDGMGGLPPGTLNGNGFGSSVVSLGDLDKDGVDDLAVGAIFGAGAGAVYVLLMNSDGTVKYHVRISDGESGLAAGSLSGGAFFGSAVANLGDLNGDGVHDMAVGARHDESLGGDSNEGSVFVLLMNNDGTVKGQVKISDGEGGLAPGTLDESDLFGSSVATVGDLNGDGIADMAVGAETDESLGGDSSEGAVYVLLMNTDGTVKDQVKISDGEGGLDAGTLDGSDLFGSSVATLGDLDGDGVADLAVGARSDENDAGSDSAEGAVYVLLMNDDGTVRDQVKITDGEGGLAPGTLDESDRFGRSTASLGDLDGDGVADIAIGAEADESTGGDSNEGAVYVLLLNSDGTVKDQIKISDGEGGLASGSLRGGAFFGSGVTNLGDLDGDGVADMAVGAFGESAVWILNLSPLLDFGDAPDATNGTASGDYQTTADNDGPRHTVSFAADIFMGALVDTEVEALPSNRANGDDITTLPNDEDGLNNPRIDLSLTVGTQPKVNVIVTNETGSTATLSGWIDYNADGVFDNATERTQIAVPDGTNGEIVTLAFPLVRFGFTGLTYARFRLSTDMAAEIPTGLASDGEVEDYPVTIVLPSNGTVDSHTKISDTVGNFTGVLDNGDQFGRSVAALGDLNGDGVTDLAVGASHDDDGGSDIGAVWIQFLENDGSVDSHQKISDLEGNFNGTLDDGDRFGISVASLGDLNGDGVNELLVGAPNDDDGGTDRGALWVLFLDSSGMVQSHQKISDAAGSLQGLLGDGDLFGFSAVPLGDLNADGVTDIAVGSQLSDDGGTDRRAVWVLFLNADGTVKSHQKISDTEGSFTGTLNDGDSFGVTLAALGDLNGDGVTELAVGAHDDDDGGTDRGAVWVLFLNSDGTVQSHQKISDTEGMFTGTLDDGDLFGRAVAAVGDLDADGVRDLAVGANFDDDGGMDRGAVWLLRMNSDGTVKSHTKISDTEGNFTGVLDDDDRFGNALSSLGDLNGDGVTDLVVGALVDDNGGDDRGAVWLLNLDLKGFVVSNTNDSGASSLRQAILDANAAPGADSIAFDIPGSGPHTIQPQSPLPAITDPVVIDGTSEPDFSGTPVIEIDGSGAGGSTRGLTVSTGGDGSTIHGLAINRFGSDGVLIANVDGVTLQGNHIGVNPAGTATLANARGVVLSGATNVTIGGISANAGNTISGNSGIGVLLTAASNNNTIEGNRIGTAADGMSRLANGGNGLRIQGSSTGNTIGGAAVGAGNTISGNNGHGIFVTGASTTGNLVLGNHIGTNSAGTAAVGNSQSGVFFSSAPGNTIGGPSSGQGNTISGNNSIGLLLIGNSTNTTVQGNRIGTNPAGDAAVPNRTGMVLSGASSATIGGTAAGAGNVISGNTGVGVLLTGGSTNNAFEDNLVGTTLDGASALANGGTGVRLQASSTNNTIGGAASGAGNVISGNSGHGVAVANGGTTGNTIAGNLIGTNAAGLAAIPNLQSGVFVSSAPDNTIGGTAAGAGNTISGNSVHGILLTRTGTTNNVVAGNRIGSDATGGSPVPNLVDGVFILNSPGNTIGGAAPGAGNLITASGVHGVVVSGLVSTGNTISANSIFGNTLLGIDLDTAPADPGRTDNDAGDTDLGPNNVQNFPVITGAMLGSGTLDVTFSVDSATGNSAYDLTVEFFLADLQHGEGQTFLDAATYTAANAGFSVTETITIPAGVTVNPGDQVLATATDAQGNTSEFSLSRTVASPLMALGEASQQTRKKSQELEIDQLVPIVDASVERLAAAGFDAKLLSSISVSIADLPGAMLGLATRNSITLDVNGAGYGWFIDTTPLDDVELSNPQSALRNPHSIDLLTVVMHELGHVAGLADLFDPDAKDDLMYGWLEVGIRKTSLAASSADAAFAQF